MKKVLNKSKGVVIFVVILTGIIGLSVYSIKNNNKLGELTSEQKLEDFTYMYDILKDNYTYFDANRRLYGYDWLGHKEEFEKEINGTKNNIEFFNSLDDILQRINDSHCYIMPPKNYFHVLHNFKNIMENYMEEYAEEYRKGKFIADVIISSENKYNTWLELFKEKYPEIYRYYDKNPIYVDNNTNTNSNFKTEILEKDKIAYLKVWSMFADIDTVNRDGKEILKFLKEIKKYPYLIIDIMGNGGGTDLYWSKNIVAPLIKNKLKEEHYAVIRGGKYSLQHYKSMYGNIENINNLPYNKNYPKEIENKFKYYVKAYNEISPENSVGFNGKIYLLIDDKVFSAADSFANFSKATNFATLLGCTTKGGGMGPDPLFMQLPNSGLLVVFEGLMGLNSDGTAHYETKTIPDIELNTVLLKNKGVINKTVDMIHKNEHNK